MMACEDREASVRVGRVSLILPLLPGVALSGRSVAEYRGLLQANGDFDSVEVVVAGHKGRIDATVGTSSASFDRELDDGAIHVTAEGWEWSSIVRAGLGAATGDHLIVLDVRRHYSPESLTQVVAPVRTGSCDIAVAVPHPEKLPRLPGRRRGNSLGVISRLFLGTSDVFSGLYALDRSVWERAGRIRTLGKSPVLDSLLRRPTRCIDVKVGVDDRFRSHRVRFSDLRPLKHVLDSRFGNYSRLAQFCMVGASGMVVDLTFYAFFQWLFSFTPLADSKSAVFGGSWHLAIAAALAIAIALVWNFTLNRRLTFNDATKGSIARQFLTYAFSNALAIVLSFSVRLYLPSRIEFFAHHRLAAAVVGIVAATGISFSMSRWLVFSRRTEPAPSEAIAH